MAGNGDEADDEREMNDRAIAILAAIDRLPIVIAADGPTMLHAVTMMMANLLATTPTRQRPAYVLGTLRNVTDMLNFILATRAGSTTEDIATDAPKTSDTKH